MARTADTNQPKEHRMSCALYAMGRVGCRRGAVTAWGLAGHQSVSDEQLHCISLVGQLGDSPLYPAVAMGEE